MSTLAYTVLQIVEFYAPWCGHCQSLKPAYEKAAKNLDGLAKVVAVDCDVETNKQFCGRMGIKGFPTLKIVRPGKKFGKPIVEDYQGARTASGITEAVVSKINNHVTRLTEKDLTAFLAGSKPKAILFTEKGTTSALLRSVAIDFLDVISVGQARNKETAIVDKFGITSFPKLVLIPADGQEPITYDGELNKKDLVEFLKQAGEPNPESSPSSGKTKAGKEGKPSKKTETKSSKPTKEAEQAAEEPTDTTTAASPAATTIAITTITTHEQLVDLCLQQKSQTCLLAIVPSEASETGDKVVSSLSQLNTKYINGKRHLFPFYSVPSQIKGSTLLKEALKLTNEVELIAINARRSWWRQYSGDFSVHSVEAWIDAIRMGEGTKNKLPEGIVVEPASSSAKDEPTKAPEAEEKTTHDEL